MKRAVSTGGVLTRLNRVFFPISISAIVLILLGLFVVTDTTIVVQGSYALIGLLLAAVAYHKLSAESRTVSPNRRRRARAAKGVGIVLFLSVSFTVLTGTRALVLLVGVPLGYLLLAVQYVNDQPPSRLVPQIAAVFALSPLTKHATTAFYWGNGDLLKREGEIRRLLSSGHLSGIDTLYEFFPGLHLLTGTASLVSGLTTHDAMLLAGIVTYTAVIGAAYVIARQVTGSTRLAIAITFGLSLLRPIHFYTTYFYSQSLAIALAVFVLLLVFKRTEEQSRSVDAALLLCLFAIVITHHFSLVLLAPLVAVLGVVGVLNSRDAVTGVRFVMPLVILGVVAVAYWAYRGWAFWFFVQLISAVYVVLPNILGVFSAGSGEQIITTLGTTAPTASLQSIVAYPPYVYLIVLVAMFVLGMVVSMEDYRQVLPFASLLVAGILAAGLMFETPVSLKGLKRARLAWTLPFAFVVGLGIFRLKQTSWSQMGKLALACSLVVAGAAAPMAAADDLGSFSQNPRPQAAYDESEYKQMAASAEFSDRYGERVTSLWIATLTYESFGATAVESPGIDDSGIRVDGGLFLYRNQWTNHRVMYATNKRDLAPMYISERYLQNAIASENEVYATGQVGLTWSESGRSVGA